MSTDVFWTPSGVRLRSRTRRPGSLDWLFLPGGPGIGSESLHELVDSAELPGTTWLVDLPGDGSNTDAPGAPADPYSVWPQVLLEAVDALPRPIYVGHSTGGMYLLSTPALESRLAGMVLVSTAPNASWLPAFVTLTEQHPLPAVAAATQAYEKQPTDKNLAAIAVASAAWNFGPDTVDAGRELLARMPYHGPAVAWSDENFDHSYAAAWWPGTLPTLIISGGADRIVTQHLWDDNRYHGTHVTRAIIDGGGHFPWIENPAAVRAALHQFAQQTSPALAVTDVEKPPTDPSPG